MEKKSNWLNLNDIINLSETEPDRQVWCINEDTYKDFMMSAKDIKDTIGNFEWSGWSFMPLTKLSEKSVIDDEEDYIKFKTIFSHRASDLDEKLNQFSKEHCNILDTQFQITNLANEMFYAVLIKYRD